MLALVKTFKIKKNHSRKSSSKATVFQFFSWEIMIWEKLLESFSGI